MKQTLLSLCSILVLLNSLQAQVSLSFTPDDVSVSDFIDITDNEYEIVGYATVTNNGSATVDLRWERFIIDMPEAWEIQICDLNFCYNPEVYSNFIAGEIEVPVTLEPGASTNMDVHLKPRGVAGTGEVRIDVSETDSPSEVISSGTFSFEALTVSSSRDLRKQPITIFPNPASDYFALRGDTDVDRVVLYNIVGREVRSFTVFPGQRYFIGDLPNGLYLASLVSNKKGIRTTLRLNKSSMRP